MKKILVIALMMLLGSSGAWALTLAGLNITNSASLTYSAGGVDQTNGGADPVGSNTDTFVVDEKIDFTLANNDGDQVTSNVVPGAEDINTTWTLTNTGNMDQNFTLASINLTSNESIYGDPDTAGKDTGTQVIWYSTDNGTTWIDFSTTPGYIEIDGDHSGHVVADRTVLIRVASDIPSNAVNDDIMNIQLTATAVQSDGATTEVNTGGVGGVDRQGAMDTVLAENTSALPDAESNTATDAIIKRWGGYKVTTAVLDLTKESCVIWDPINTNGATRKRIPGAVVRYAIDLNNTGTADATNVILTDSVPTNTTYGTGTSGLTQIARIVTETCDCDNPGASNGDSITVNGAGDTVTANYATVTQSTHECAYFDVTID